MLMVQENTQVNFKSEMSLTLSNQWDTRAPEQAGTTRKNRQHVLNHTYIQRQTVEKVHNKFTPNEV